MTDVRVAQRVRSPEPTLPAHLATKNYVDLATAPYPNDAAHYGDLVTPTRRDNVVNRLALTNGFWTFSTLIAPKPATVGTVRFYVATAATATTTPSVALRLYDDGTQVATAAVVAATFATVGVKELALSASVPVIAGHRYTWLVYIAPGSYGATPPAIACTAAGFTDLLAPTAALTYTGFKAASTDPPTSITTGDGTWTAVAATPWWALL